MNVFKRISLLVVIGLLAAACAPYKAPARPSTTAPPAAASPMLAIAPDIVARAATLKPIDMDTTQAYAKLADWERRVLDKLVQAADLMNAAYWQQVDPEGEVLFRAWASATDPQQKAARFMLDAHYGRWDRFKEFAPFVGDTTRPVGGYVFPPDLTKDEWAAYLAAHPDQKDDLLSPYTVVQRDGDKLVAVPYHEVYAAYVLPAADLLDAAAALSQNASLAKYLQLQAKALRTDQYFDADMAWLDVDGNLDVSIGPHETYDDQITGQKAFYKANVLIVDQEAGARLDKFKAAVPALQANLPVPAEFRPDQAGTLTPMELADDVYRTGQARSVMEGVAFSLPNDPKVWEAKGAKKVIMRNFVETRRATVLGPLADAIMAEAIAQEATADGYFNWLLMHEVSHSLGPRTVKKDGQEITVRQALGNDYQPIEEGKADISGLYNLTYLRDHGVITGSLASHYIGFLSEALRSIRFGEGSAYGVIRGAAWNFFVEKGALTLDAAAGRFNVDVDRMTEAAKELAITLLTIEGNGDIDGAAAFINKYSYVAPELKALLEKANATVPVEFVPYFKVPTSTSTSTSTYTNGPLKDVMNTLTPPSVWNNFYQLTQVPRPSRHEEKATAFLSDFGKSLGLETIVDEVGNVIIRKPATAGMEKLAGVVLQAHMDMVPQKTPDKTQDFEKDPIDARVEGGWVKADRTTLGADDGIGVAMIMAVLQSKDAAHGPLEALFSVNEEDGFTGVNGLQPGVLKGSIFINVDSETEGVFTIGSAGGVYVNVTGAYGEDATPADRVAYKLEVTGLKGGHSGVDINLGRGSASKLLTRMLWEAPGALDLRVASLLGGDRANAIPREAAAIVTIPKTQADAFVAYTLAYSATVRSELAAAEPDLVVQAAPTDLPPKVMAVKDQAALIAAVYGSVNGVIRMSDAVPGLVESSTSMGIVSAADGKLTATCYVRSAVDSARDDVAHRIGAVFELAGATVAYDGPYSGWRPNPDSPILGLMKQTYQDLFGKQAQVIAIHAGLETSVVGVTYPGMDMISIGPTLLAVHSPDERLEIASVQKAYDLLLETLKRIPAK